MLSGSREDTYKIGNKLGKKLKPGDVVALLGELGSGKTVFTSGIAAAFNINNVHSPTFTIVNEYNAGINFYHFDAYRISESDWIDCGFDEYLDGEGICVIEWADNIKNVLPDNLIKVTFTRKENPDLREISIEGVEF
jgi:tRNA threonylcarbamoyladenosine biosynthesis protein TsaE